MTKYALPIAAFIIVILLLCNTTTIGVLLYQTFRNPANESYALVKMVLDGDGSAKVGFDRSGLRANTVGNVEVTAVAYIYEPELLSPSMVAPTFTPTPAAPIGYSDPGILPVSVGPTAPVDNLALAIIATLIAPTATATPTVTPEPAIYTLSGSSRYRLRACPRQDCSIEGHVYPGQRLKVLGKDRTGTWLLLEDEYGRKLWTSGESAIVIGVSSHIAIIDVSSHRLAVPTAIYVEPTRMPELASPVPISKKSPYALVGQESFSSDEPQRILVWIHGEDGHPIGGISFEIRHNGRIVRPDEGWMVTSIPTAHTSWPRPYGDEREREYNAKMEFRNEVPGGEWEITPFYQGLANGIGEKVGKSATFSVPAGTTNELYVEYQKK